MKIGSRIKWNKYLADLATDRFRKRLIKKQQRFKNKKYEWSFSSRQSIGDYYQTELCHRPTAAEIAFGNLLCELNLIPFHFQKLILSPKIFILDFYIQGHFVAFEIDGESHLGKEDQDLKLRSH